MRIFAGGISTETNTFAAEPTGLEDFIVQRGPDLSDGLPPNPSLNLIQSWRKLAVSRGDEFIFSLMAWAEPSGTTIAAAYELLRDELLHDLKDAGPLDIVLLNLHGAMVATGYDDCEEDVIKCVRRIVGSDVIIGVELDLHCNVTAATIRDADIVISYKEYPHTDVIDRAAELFELAVRSKEGAIRPTTAIFDCRMVGMYPTTREPLRGFIDDLLRLETERKEILSLSFCHGFQFADVAQGGAKIIAITDNDMRLAKQLAGELGHRLHELRSVIGFDAVSLPMEEALSRALQVESSPVVVADQSDNTGGGAPGDSTFALRWLIDHNVKHAAIAVLYDPEVVRIAKKAGVGSQLRVRLGGKLSALSGDPIDLDCMVGSVRSGFLNEFPQETGLPLLYPLGDIVLLRADGIDIVVSSQRGQCFSPTVFTELGVDISSKKLLVVKSYQHFHGAFSSIASEIIYMAAQGAVPPDPRLLDFNKLSTRNLFPWSKNPSLDS